MNELASSRRHRNMTLALTLARIPLALLFAALYALSGPSPWRVLVALLLLSAMELSDVFDGLMARRLGVVSEWGAMLDPYADSVSRLIVFWTLAWAGYVLWITVLVMALRDVTVSYCRVTLTRHGITVKAKRSGKIKAIVQAIAGLLLVLGPVVDVWTGEWIYPALSWLVVLVTAASSVEYVAAALSAANAAAD
jgi:CDP-diacylglycerol--glycerol-3-phosphate 3-phosphatidyltransferase